MTPEKDLVRRAPHGGAGQALCRWMHESAWLLAVLTENRMLNRALGNKSHTQLGSKASLWQRQLVSAEAHPPPVGLAARICL